MLRFLPVGYRRFATKFPRFTMSLVRHPWRAGASGVAVVACVVAASILVPRVFADCGPGMVENGTVDACVGVDLAGGPFTGDDPPRMRALESQIQASNDEVSDDYVSIVLLLDMSPMSDVDTENYPDLYSEIEGAVTAVWQANHTAGVYGKLPKIKLFLGNMGSLYGAWSTAVDQITAMRAANHITSVIGLGQSTDATRAASAKIVADAKLPVIGATVSGDTMNDLPGSTQLNDGFFRIPATNTATVAVAARYLATIEPDQSKIVIIHDKAKGDDYVQTLGKAAISDMPRAYQLPYTSPGSVPPGLQRDQELIQQFIPVDQNACAVNPTVVYFAGRGEDLGGFLESWTQSGTVCATNPLTVITGDDGEAAINETEVRQAATHGVRVLFTAEASPDEWGACSNNAAQKSYDTFQAAFTGEPDVCDGQRVTADDKTAPLSFGPRDLEGGEGILTHDAMVVAVTAARKADLGQDPGNGGIVVSAPDIQKGIIEEMCSRNAVLGASGWIEYSQNDPGNAIDRPVPIVQIDHDGSTRTVWNPSNTAAEQNPNPNC